MIDMEQLVEIQYSNRIKKYYENKGYIFPNSKSTIMVRVADLSMGSGARVKYTCNSCGNVTKITYDAYNKNVNDICHRCISTKAGKSKLLPFSVVRKAFEDEGYEIIVDGEYKNTNDKIKYVCPSHGIQSSSYSNFVKGHRCKKCDNDSRRGSNNIAWKGGVSILAEMLRNSITSWTQEELRRTNYTCELTGKRGVLNVHHMTSFVSIVQRTMDELNMDIRRTIGDYSNNELQLITTNFIKNNDIYANPIVMLESVHRDFHSFCGGYSKDTSLEQLEQFKETLKDVA